jgi:uncharacterized protein (TIGR02145 family)
MEKNHLFGMLPSLSVGAVILFVAVLMFSGCSKKDDNNPVKPAYETGSLTDADGNTYRTVKIGNQWWMAENLKVTHYRNDDEIFHIKDSATWSTLNVGAYSHYHNDSLNDDVFGLLYNGYVINDNRLIAPRGWHIPSDEEWKELEMCLGMSRAQADSSGLHGTDEGGKLKEAGTIHWQSPNKGATNASGFSALPAGARWNDGSFGETGFSADFWSTTHFDTTYNIGYTWARNLSYNFSAIYRYPVFIQCGLSVRCVRD